MDFGGPDDGGSGERMVQQVLSGQKTATCDLVCWYTAEDIAAACASVGTLATLSAGDGRPRGQVRITRVYRTPFGNPSPSLVRGEGHGENAEHFKRVHEAFWRPDLEAEGDRRSPMPRNCWSGSSSWQNDAALHLTRRERRGCN